MDDRTTMSGRPEHDQVLGGRFRLVEPFAEDPLLEVWLAEDLELRREVVIKLLLPRWMDDEEMLERFRFDAMVAAGLLHENVARTYDVEHSGDRLFAVTEYVPGPTVEELLAGAPLEPQAVAAIGRQVALGLASMHEQGLVHAAVCPSNLVVALNGRLCIIDFGSVRLLSADDRNLPDPVFPEPGVRDYWPPERLEGSPPDAHSDVYSLGLLMWEALHGGRDIDATESRPVRRLLASLPGGDEATPLLRDLLVGATSQDPTDRPGAAELAEQLIEVCGSRPQDHLEVLVRKVEGSA